MRKLTCLVISFLAMVLINSVCFGETIYVEQLGGGDYTTIAAAINAAYPDDTIKVGPGVYEVGVTINKNIKLIGSGPKYTKIKSSLNGIGVVAGYTAVISNFTITAGSNGIFMGRNARVTISNNVIEGCGDNGIYHHDASSGYDAKATIINNTIAYNNNDGVHFYNYTTTLGLTNISGNIIVFNGANGLNLRAGTENISYNNIYNNSTNYVGCSAGTGDISFNPLFIDLSAGNYALQTTSYCIDSGIPGEIYNDPDGTRNDMGAYSGPPSAAFWPYISSGPVVTEIFLTPASVPRGGTLTIQAKGRVQ